MSEIASQGDAATSLHPPMGMSADAKPRVLYVDDQPRALEALARALWDRFDVVTSAHPLEILSLLERDGDFDVVIADVKMPDMNGLTFLRRVQALSPTTTRLVFTGMLGIDAGAIVPGTAFRVIEKPCATELLIEIVADAARYHALLAASPFQPVERPIRTPMRPPAIGGEDVSPPDLTRYGGGRDGSVRRAPLTPSDGSPGVPMPSPFQGRIGLRMLERTVELLQGTTIVGRSRTCHIALDDPGVSRQHACFLNDGHELTVRNIADTNEVLVNGAAIEGAGPHRLEVGDVIRIGSRELRVDSLGDYCPSFEPTQRPRELGGADAAPPRNDVPTFAGIADAVAKYAQVGEWRHAERILRPLLDGLLRFCRDGQRPIARDLELAQQLALSLAEFNQGGEWISYVFDLLAALQVPANSDVVERLYRIVPTVPGISMASYRGYLKALADPPEPFGAAQRFLIRRIRGLESALMTSAHL